MLRGAYPYRALSRATFVELLAMLADGFSTRRGRHGALIHHDAVNGLVRGRRGARLTALTSGGTIPDMADYRVMLEPDAHLIGTVNEDFAIESLAGDVFQLGNASYRILRVERGTVRVEDARGAPPSIPFWFGEAPGRTDALSASVSRLRADLAAQLGNGDRSAACDWLRSTVGIGRSSAVQLVDYLAAAHGALGCLPTQGHIVLERFFDEAGGLQLILHTPFGSRINRAWGLALRKRFCRAFNFELQAAATEDCIVLSLTTAHSFDLGEVARYLHSNTVRPLLVQALLAAPMFTSRWRWAAAVALALPRFRGGKKVPPQIARMNAEDLMVAIFPDQVACAENIAGDIEVPDHPLVRQTVRDCLEDAMDIEGLERVLGGLESGAIRVTARDLTEPSPLALEVLSARPYAFLDDVPLEERRTHAVMGRRWIDPESASDLGKLDPDAIRRVRDEAWPDASTTDELHDALYWLGFLTEREVADRPGWLELLNALAAARRATRLRLATGAQIWVTAERLPLFAALVPEAVAAQDVEAPAQRTRSWTRDEAVREIVRGRLEGLGPTTAAALASGLAMPDRVIDGALVALEAEGFAMRGRFTPDANGGVEWCERRLLARIHRYTVKRLRAEIEPVAARDLMRFLFEWQHVVPETRMQGPDAVAAILAQLEGFEGPAAAWETELLPARIEAYEPAWLDQQCLAGRYVWVRLAPRNVSDTRRGAAPVRATPIVLLARRNLRLWSELAGRIDIERLTPRARDVACELMRHGASFFDELLESTGLLASQLEEALAELVALGCVNSDSFGGLRALLIPSDRRRSSNGGRRRRRVALFGMSDAGRWSLATRRVPGLYEAEGPAAAATVEREIDPEAIEHVVRTLLRRWGVVFWRLLVREADWLPPWRELLAVLRRLEARGEIRGGRFVAGISGEQFALPEAIGLLREVRRRPDTGQVVSLSAADPLNLVGLLSPGARVPALVGNRVLFRDGVPTAQLVAGEVEFRTALEPTIEWELRNALLRRQIPEQLAHLVK
jgi:ATP-dependent Lhr-like helicase